MARILVTGSADGLGLMAGRLLAEDGHRVVLHARGETRAEAAGHALPQAESILIGDVSTIAGMRSVAEQADHAGPYDAVIHNVGIGYQEPRRVETEDGLSQLFAVNVLAPYLLTALVPRPRRLVYLSSGMARSGNPDLDDPQWTRRRWQGSQAYADSKLFDMLLAFGVARHWPDVPSNSVDPGWVATRMGGPGATDDLALGPATQVWLATGDDPGATVTGRHFFHRGQQQPPHAARVPENQDALLAYCARLTGVPLP